MIRTRKPLTSKAMTLKQLPLFRSCSDGDLELAASLADETLLHPGTMLAREGTAGWQAFVIVSGRASVHVGGRRVGMLVAGEPVGEAALLDGGRHRATVVAETAIHAIVLTPAALERLVAETAFGRTLLASMSRRLGEALAVANG